MKASNKIILGALIVLMVSASVPAGVSAAERTRAPRIVIANVVALDQPIVHNRMGTVTPQGMMFALRRDVEACDASMTDCRPESEGGALLPGLVRLRPDKRPRPPVLRMNVGDVLQVNFTNLLTPDRSSKSLDQPATRSASVHVVGVELIDGILSDGSHVGRNAGSLANPGESRTYRYYAEREGCFLITSNGAVSGGGSGLGSLAFGLFGALNVEPHGSEWLRSQISHEELLIAARRDADGNVLRTPDGHPLIDYEARYPAGRFAGEPVLRMLGEENEIIHADLNAIITGAGHGSLPEGTYRPNAGVVPLLSDDALGRRREEPFREFTVIFHDDVPAVQAFPQFKAILNSSGQDVNPLASVLRNVRDASGINFGMSGLGASVLSNRLGVGPAADCTECKFEEFVHTSWVLGDPALIVDRPAALNVDPETGERVQAPVSARKALYPDDPSNVFHSYLNDHVKIRNLNAGARHQLFHVHGHQWLTAPDDDNSSYRDVQGIGPGAGHTYEISHNGTGNRNLTPGDALISSQMMPSRAQGMWALWRAHDTFEEGTPMAVDPDDAGGATIPAPGSRALPDGEIVSGTPIPAVVPLPGRPMAPMPARVQVAPRTRLFGSQVDFLEREKNPGYPFFIAGVAGHRPPKPPLETLDDGGLPRHVITGGAQGSSSTHHVETRMSFDKRLAAVRAVFLPEEGTEAEIRAMEYHSKRFHPTFLPDGTPAGNPEIPDDAYGFKTNGLPPARGAPYADPCVDDHGQRAGAFGTKKVAAFQMDVRINKAEWHSPQTRLMAHWHDVEPTLSGARAPEPFFTRVNANDCMEIQHTNLLPNVLEMDDFRIRVPTDVVGQHAHLLKFDLTASDGSAAGWNYEDGSLSPMEVQERIAAINAGQGGIDGRPLVARAHPFFSAQSLPGVDLTGAQTTVQRWYADRLVNNEGKARPLGTALTSDQLAPATNQPTGLLGMIGVEPEGSTWRDPETGESLGKRDDGGPTRFRADILSPGAAASYREFFLLAAGMQATYARGPLVPMTDPDQPDGPVVGHGSPALAVNAPVLVEESSIEGGRKASLCRDRVHAPPCPEAILAEGTGTITVNLRNEPLALRLLNAAGDGQASGEAGDLAFVYRSDIEREIAALNAQPGFSAQPLTRGVGPGDPFTPLLRVNEGDRVLIRAGAGLGERLPMATFHGLRWLADAHSSNSGWKNAQAIDGVQTFDLTIPVLPRDEDADEPVDHLYKLGASIAEQWHGTWGLLRAYRREGEERLHALPDNPLVPVRISNREEFNGVCPANAPVRKWDVTAVSAADALPPASRYGINTTRMLEVGSDVGTLVYNRRRGMAGAFRGPLHDPTAILYVRTADLDATGRLLPEVPVEPLVLRATAGECVEVTLRNGLPKVDRLLLDVQGNSPWSSVAPRSAGSGLAGTRQVGLHPQLLTADNALHDGTNVGGGRKAGGERLLQTVGPGEAITYRWYAGMLSLGTGNRLIAIPVEFGATGLVPADTLKQPGKGLVGALIIEPQKARWLEDPDSRASAFVRPQSERPFREHVVILQDGITLLDADGSPVTLPDFGSGSVARGGEGINYRSEPFWLRLGYGPRASATETNKRDFSSVLSNESAGSDPETPVFSSRARTPLRLRVLHPATDGSNHVFSLHAHSWDWMPFVAQSMRMTSNPGSGLRGLQEGIGPYAHFDFILRNGVGGKFGLRGDFLMRDRSPLSLSDGMWGILRVQ